MLPVLEYIDYHCWLARLRVTARIEARTGEAHLAVIYACIAARRALGLMK
jgi:hypothetical protein